MDLTVLVLTFFGLRRISALNSVIGNSLSEQCLGDAIAFGIRNPAGFAFKDHGLHVVENGASIDQVPGFEGAFANDNPADELNFVDLSINQTRSYGFPDCTTVWNPSGRPGLAKGDQFSLNLDPTRDDAWCKQTQNNVPPVLDFQVRGT